MVFCWLLSILFIIVKCIDRGTTTNKNPAGAGTGRQGKRLSNVVELGNLDKGQAHDTGTVAASAPPPLETEQEDETKMNELGLDQSSTSLDVLVNSAENSGSESAAELNSPMFRSKRVSGKQEKSTQTEADLFPRPAEGNDGDKGESIPQHAKATPVMSINTDGPYDENTGAPSPRTQAFDDLELTVT